MSVFEQRMVGTWRSYKLFHFNGKMEQHNTSFFIELSIDQNEGLTLFHTRLQKQALVLKPHEWEIQETPKRRYLYFGKKQAYEIITLEPEDLVIADVVRGEKVFFAKMPGWHQRIETVITSIRHINAEKETKDQ